MANVLKKIVEKVANRQETSVDIVITLPKCECGKTTLPDNLQCWDCIHRK